MNILLVEDDLNLGILLQKFLIAKGFKCDLKRDGQNAYEAYNKKKYDFLILDIMMPLKDGFTLAKEIRGIDQEVPILFLSAKSLTEDKLKGFEIGADDYLTKPFQMEELLARINAINKRRGNDNFEDQNNNFQLKNLDYNPQTKMLSILDKEYKLTDKEHGLFHILIKNKNRTVNRDDLLKAVWGSDDYFKGRSMDVYITKLRKYLKEVSDIEIVNVHSTGYKLLEM